MSAEGFASSAGSPAQGVEGVRVAVFARMPAAGYSGGRYHTWALLEALSAIGVRVDLFTDNHPVFAADFARYPGHDAIRVRLVEDFKRPPPLGSHDAVLLVPGMDRKADLYRCAVRHAALSRAPLLLLNFETPNWFNSLVSQARDPDLWRFWEATARYCSGIVSTTRTSQRFAEDYFPEHPALRHYQLYAAINDLAAKAARGRAPEKRVLLFNSRQKYGEHKGIRTLGALVGPELAGFTIAVISGNEDLPPSLAADLTRQIEALGARLEILHHLDDDAKFDQIARARFLIFPSTFEGYGYPPVEAMAMQRRCVAFDLPVLRETCGDYHVYARHGDVEDLRVKIAETATGDAWVGGEEGPSRAREVASMAAFGAGAANILRDVLGRATVWSRRASLQDTLREVDQHFDRAVALGHLHAMQVAAQEAAPLPSVTIDAEALRRRGDLSEADRALRDAQAASAAPAVPAADTIIIAASARLWHDRVEDDSARSLTDLHVHLEAVGYRVLPVLADAPSALRVDQRSDVGRLPLCLTDHVVAGLEAAVPFAPRYGGDAVGGALWRLIVLNERIGRLAHVVCEDGVLDSARYRPDEHLSSRFSLLMSQAEGFDVLSPSPVSGAQPTEAAFGFRPDLTRLAREGMAARSNRRRRSVWVVIDPSEGGAEAFLHLARRVGTESDDVKMTAVFLEGAEAPLLPDGVETVSMRDARRNSARLYARLSKQSALVWVSERAAPDATLSRLAAVASVPELVCPVVEASVSMSAHARSVRDAASSVRALLDDEDAWMDAYRRAADVGHEVLISARPPFEAWRAFTGLSTRAPSASWRHRSLATRDSETDAAPEGPARIDRTDQMLRWVRRWWALAGVAAPSDLLDWRTIDPAAAEPFEDDLRRLLAVFPDDPLLLMVLCELSASDGRFDDAEAYARRAAPAEGGAREAAVLGMLLRFAQDPNALDPMADTTDMDAALRRTPASPWKSVLWSAYKKAHAQRLRMRP